MRVVFRGSLHREGSEHRLFANVRRKISGALHRVSSLVLLETVLDEMAVFVVYGAVHDSSGVHDCEISTVEIRDHMVLGC